MKPEFDDEELRLRAGRRVSLREVILWITGLAICLSAPGWVGVNYLQIFFYVSLIALTWRLSRAMRFSMALGIALAVAIGLTYVMVVISRR